MCYVSLLDMTVVPYSLCVSLSPSVIQVDLHLLQKYLFCLIIISDSKHGSLLFMLEEVQAQCPTRAVNPHKAVGIKY